MKEARVGREGPEKSENQKDEEPNVQLLSASTQNYQPILCTIECNLFFCCDHLFLYPRGLSVL